MRFVEDTFCIETKHVLKQVPHPGLSVWEEKTRDGSWMVIANGQEAQPVTFSWVVLSYGERAYFECTCGKRTSKLYLPSGSFQLKCRLCYKLRYRELPISRYSVAGKKLHAYAYAQRLAERREKMRRVIYKGKFIRKFETLLKKYEQAGLHEFVESAEKTRQLLTNSK